MWARVVEAMLGCWLAISPVVFQPGAADLVLWTTDLVAALAVVVFALASYWPPLRHAHLATLVVAAGLVVVALVPHGAPPPATAQNHFVAGLLLAMFAVVPNEASQPPRAWRRGPARGVKTRSRLAP